MVCVIYMMSAILLTDGVGCMDIELSEEPQLGRWSARARLILVKTIAICIYIRSCT